MKRLSVLLALVLMLAAGCGIAAPAGATETPAAKDGPWSDDEATIKKFEDMLQSHPSVDFTLKSLDGKDYMLSDFKGKVVLLNFWATWCPPCQAEMPEFQKLYERFGADGPAVILTVAGATLEGDDPDKAKETVSDFISKNQFTFPVLFDADGQVWDTYMQEGIPANYIIDGEGNVRLLVSGAFRNEAQLYAALEAVRRAESGQ